MGFFQNMARAMRSGFRAEAQSPVVRSTQRVDFGDADRGALRPVVPDLPRKVYANEFTDLIVGLIECWDVDRTRCAVNDHDNGQFTGSAALVDFMLRDDRVMSALNTRVIGLQSLPFEIAPAIEKDAQAEEIAKALTEDWQWICPPSVIEELIRWEAMMGFALAEIVWDTSGDRWVPRIKIWHPQYIYYRLDLRRYVAIAQEGLVYITPGDGKWLLFSRHGNHRAWIHGAVRSLFVPFLMRMYTWRDWGRYNERHGLPIMQAMVPASASDTDKRRFFSQLQSLGTTGALLATENESGQKFALELVEATNQQAWQAFDGLLSRAETVINLVLLGQNLSGGNIEGGSFAAAKVADGVRDDFKFADALALSADLYTQVCRPWTVFNFGDEKLTPKPTWITDAPEDQDKAASTLRSVADAVQVFVTLGADIDLPALIERFNLPIRPGKPLALPAPAPMHEPAQPPGETPPPANTEAA
jgi:phage gp29-like protein